MDRYETLRAAADAVAGREGVYGSPQTAFSAQARIISAVLRDKLLSPLSASDVVVVMCCVKLARLRESPGHADSIVDLAGYAALMAEVGQ